MSNFRFLLLLHLKIIFLSLFVVIRAEARITKIVIDRTESPTFAGREFGLVGSYEKVTGRQPDAERADLQG